MPTDSQLIEKIKRGDMSSFKLLVERYQDKVYSIALGMIGMKDAAEDVAQEVFLAVYRNIGAFRGQSAFSTWLYRVVVNRCTDWRRREIIRLNSFVDNNDLYDNIEGNFHTEECVIKKLEYEELKKCISYLPDRYKLPLYLYYYGEQSYKEMSVILGISVKGVEVRMARAREMLKHKMEVSHTDKREYQRGGDFVVER